MLVGAQYSLLNISLTLYAQCLLTFCFSSAIRISRFLVYFLNLTGGDSTIIACYLWVFSRFSLFCFLLFFGHGTRMEPSEMLLQCIRQMLMMQFGILTHMQ